MDGLFGQQARRAEALRRLLELCERRDESPRLDASERQRLATSYRRAIAERRQAQRQQQERCLAAVASKTDGASLAQLSETIALIRRLVKVLRVRLLPLEPVPSTQVFYWSLQAECLADLATFDPPRMDKSTRKALCAFEHAWRLAAKHLQRAARERLKLAVNYSTFVDAHVHDTPRALAIVNCAVRDIPSGEPNEAIREPLRRLRERSEKWGSQLSFERAAHGWLRRTTVSDFVYQQDEDRVRRQLIAGDDVDEWRSRYNSPIVIAAEIGNVSILRLLLAFGADINLRNHYYTALQSAVLRHHVDAALFLVECGADCDAVDYYGWTAMHHAIKLGQTCVVRAMLEHGANPDLVTADSSKTSCQQLAMNPASAALPQLIEKCVDQAAAADRFWAQNARYQLQHLARSDIDKKICRELDSSKHAPDQLFAELLTFKSYEVLEALKVFLVDVNKDMIRNLLAEYSDHNVALRSRNLVALTQITRRLIAKGETSAVCQLLVSALDAGVGPVDVKLKTLVRCALEAGDVPALEACLAYTPEEDRYSVLQSLRFENGMHAVHVTAERGHWNMMQYLFASARASPSATDDLKRTPLEVLQASDVIKKGPAIGVLDRAVRREQFGIRIGKLLINSDISMDELLCEMENVTTVYDAQVLFRLAFAVPSRTCEEMHRFVMRTCEHIISHKLVLEDQEFQFCRAALESFKAQAIITTGEEVLLSHRMLKVNMESAQWVVDIQQSLRVMEWRTERLDQDLSNLSHRPSWKNWSTTPSARKSPALFDGAIDAISPVETLLKTLELSEAEVINAATKTTTQTILPLAVQHVLGKAAIPITDFTKLIQDVVKLKDHGSDHTHSQAAPTLDGSVSTPAPSDSQPKSNSMRLRDVVHQVVMRLRQQAPTHFPFEDEDYISNLLERYPYHYAVRMSHGDVDHFDHIAEPCLKQCEDVNATATVRVYGATGSLRELELSPVEYASYLGYISLVDHLLARSDVKPIELPSRLQQRARSASVRAGARGA
ncbi:hypothetical protein P43SY_006030 [Pythium insidiosum]|uniref:14-3-3 domain-containing protein n=1 Tax=Pythium insidiosum TaxID=114742 RepID=A0AAD5LL48_PYTIN|nr:hypothetical protein P43SY_006030 [Pythium insidiosum]